MPRRDVEEWFVQVGREMASLHEELAGRPRVAGRALWEPRVDLFEEPGRLLVRAELAGVRAEDVALHFVPERHLLVIRGARPESLAGEDGRRAHLLEVPVGEFVREVPLPDVSIDARGIRAQVRNGMLIVSIPKIDRAVLRTVIVKEI